MNITPVLNFIDANSVLILIFTLGAIVNVGANIKVAKTKIPPEVITVFGHIFQIASAIAGGLMMLWVVEMWVSTEMQARYLAVIGGSILGLQVVELFKAFVRRQLGIDGSRQTINNNYNNGSELETPPKGYSDEDSSSS